MTQDDAEATDLTGEELEAVSAFRATSVGDALKALDRVSEKHRKQRSEQDFRLLIQGARQAPAFSTPAIEDYAESMRAQAKKERADAQRRADDSENFKLMAGILVQMEHERKAAQEDRRKQAMFNTLMAVLGALLAFGGIVVPFVIEAMKGWK